MSRRVRLALAGGPVVALYLLAGISERLFYAADRAFYRLRDWCDV